MLAIIEKVKDLFKCKAGKSAESASPQGEPNTEEKPEEQTQSSKESG